MNKNSTTRGMQLLTKLKSISKGIALMSLVILFSVCTKVSAQNTDLPNPDPNIQTAPAGSFIIAMDNTNQANPGYFNLKSYGLAVTLMDYGVRLRWVITAGKVKDGADINVTARSITTPTVVNASSKITLISGSPIATVNTIVGNLMPGMKVTAPGIAAGTTIADIINPSQIRLSSSALSNQSNKNATYSLSTWPVSTFNFKAGPFIIYPADTLWARDIINNFNSSLAASDKVNVFQTTAATSVDVRYDMFGRRPKGAILNDGGNANIQMKYMENAAIPTINYEMLYSATGLSAGCYTFASEPHSGNLGSHIDSIKAFVMLGGNFLAECHAIGTYENWATGHFQSTNGIFDINTNLNSNINYLNSDLSFSQYEGAYVSNQGGSIQTWHFPTGSAPQNNFYGVINGNTPALSGIYGASVSKLHPGLGGNVYYIGNHNFGGTSPEELNSQRMYLNAFLTPAVTPFCFQPRPPLAVKLNYFAAKKVNTKQVQLNWSTAIEQNTKEFIIERSANGANFTEISRVAARGNSTIEIKYNNYDYNPISGKNFYRLITVDLDGKRSYSDIVLINMDITVLTTMDIYPNPAFGQVMVNLNNLPIFNNNLAVIDLSGKTVISQSNVSGNTIKLNVAGLQAGTYFVKVNTADGIVVQNKMIVVNK